MTEQTPELPLQTTARRLHPVVWSLLYIPFGALSGFITVGLGFRATQHGLSVMDGGVIVAAQYITSWLKWLWAPVVDITLTPRRWYLISTILSAVGVVAMAVTPLEKDWLLVLTAVVVASSFINSVVGMSVEAMISSLTSPEEVGRVSAWFQSGNLGGGALGGGVALYLFNKFQSPWVSGLAMAVIFLACCVPLRFIPPIKAHASHGGAAKAVRNVVVDLWQMLKSKPGMLAALLCMLPIGTGAAQGVLAQAEVASYWHAGANDVAWLQGSIVGVFTVLGCFGGGWICDRLNARAAYALCGLGLAVVAAGMAWAPATLHAFYVGNVIYAVGTGLCYSAFTAVALTTLGNAPAATGYNVFASLSNFPIWWLNILLPWAADPKEGAHHNAPVMLLVEAGLGVLALIIFAGATLWAGQGVLGQPAVEVAQSG